MTRVGERGEGERSNLNPRAQQAEPPVEPAEYINMKKFYSRVEIQVKLFHSVPQ